MKSCKHILASLATVSTFAVVSLGAFAQPAGSTTGSAADVAPIAGGPVLTPGTSSSATAAPGAQWMQFVLIGGMVLFMYLFIIRPNAKRQKEQKAFLESLTPGKEVITSSGLIGKVLSVNDAIVTVDLGTTTVRVLKSAISGELGPKATASGTAAASAT